MLDAKLTTNYDQIRKIIQIYNSGSPRADSKGHALIKQIEKIVQGGEESKDTLKKIKNALIIYWKDYLQYSGFHRLFYVDEPRSLQAQILIKIAQQIDVPKEEEEKEEEKDEYPNLRVYKLLMDVQNPFKGFDDLSINPGEIIINSTGNYLFDINILVENTKVQKRFLNYANPDGLFEEELGVYELEQLQSKNPIAYDTINTTLKEALREQQRNPGVLSRETLRKLTIIAEITLSSSGDEPGTEPDKNALIRGRITKEMEQFPDFDQFVKTALKVQGLGSLEDSIHQHELLNYPYEYFRMYYEQLEINDPEEAKAFRRLQARVDGATVYQALQGVWTKTGCMSTAGLIIANIVYTVSPSKTVFFNGNFATHAKAWGWQKGSRTYLIGHFELFGEPNLLYELTGYYPAPHFTWYHFFIPYRQDEKAFPWKRFLVTLLLTFGMAPLIHFLNTLCKGVNFCFKSVGYNGGHFFWTGVGMLGQLWRRPQRFGTLDWIIFVIMATPTVFALVISYPLKLIAFIVSALVSPLSTYQQIKSMNEYAAYVFAIAMIAGYAALIIFAAPLLPSLAGPALISLFSQLPWVPYIVQLFTPIGTWLTTQFIQPILLAIGVSAIQSSVLAVATLITTPILLNAIAQFLFDVAKSIFMMCMEGGSGQSIPIAPAGLLTGEPVGPNLYAQEETGITISPEFKILSVEEGSRHALSAPSFIDTDDGGVRITGPSKRVDLTSF